MEATLHKKQAIAGTTNKEICLDVDLLILVLRVLKEEEKQNICYGINFYREETWIKENNDNNSEG